MFAVHRFAQGAADWRSGPRWSIISVLCPVHPFATTWHFPSRGNKKIGGTGYCVTYDIDSQSRNADFISIARRAIHNPRPEGPSNLRTLRPSGRSILRTLFHNPSTQPSGPKAPSTFPSEPYSSAISLSFSLSIIPIFFPFLRMIFFSSSRWSLRDRVSGVVPR